MPELPVQQQAAVRQGTGQDARAPITLIDVPTPAPGQLLVHIKWCLPNQKAIQAPCSATDMLL